MMKPTRAKEVLYDSETVLRLVEHQLQELHDEMEPMRSRERGPSVTEAAASSPAVSPDGDADQRPR